MSTTIKSTFIAICLFAVATGLYRYTQTIQDSSPLQNYSSKIYTAEKFRGSSYDKTGVLHHTITADTVHYDDGSGIASLTSPTVTTYRIGTKQTVEKWTISSKRGKIRDGDFALMEEDVLLKPLFDGAAITKAQSQKAHYDFKTNLIHSPDITVLHGVGWVNSGTDFAIDLNTNITTYKGNVNAIYFPPQRTHN